MYRSRAVPLSSARVSGKRPFSGQNSLRGKSVPCASRNFVPQEGMLIGYARVSTLDQNLALQRDALTAAGCQRIFTDEGVSGSVSARRGLDAALAVVSSGDTLVVWKLDLAVRRPRGGSVGRGARWSDNGSLTRVWGRARRLQALHARMA